MFAKYPRLAAGLTTTVIVGPYIHGIYQHLQKGYPDGYKQAEADVEKAVQQSNHYEAYLAKESNITKERAEYLLNAPRGTIYIMNKQWWCLIDGDKAVCTPTDTYIWMTNRWKDIVNKEKLVSNTAKQV